MNLKSILNDYLKIFPEEKSRQSKFETYLNEVNDSAATDWNNFGGHVVTGGFVYAKEDKKFLVLYHKDLKMFLYPGGHIDKVDKNPLNAVKREICEETGISNLDYCQVAANYLVPMDIDTQIIEYNERLNLSEHVHYDFRYLFTIDKAIDVRIDLNEHSEFKWIDEEEFYSDYKFKKISVKLKKILTKNNYKC